MYLFNIDLSNIKMHITLPISFEDIDISNISFDIESKKNSKQVNKINNGPLKDSDLAIFSNAKKINLDNTKITDEALKYLTNITSITIGHNDNLTKDGLKYLASAKLITINYCNNISLEDLKILKGVDKIIINIKSNNSSQLAVKELIESMKPTLT